jgi:hypothetical protein
MCVLLSAALQKLGCRRQGFGNLLSSRGDDDSQGSNGVCLCNNHIPLIRDNMNILVLLSLLLFIPFIFFLVFLALSSCMGDGFRARISGMSINPRHGSYGRGYARGLGSGAGSAGWEQIEMEDMMGEDSSDDDLPHER